MDWKALWQGYQNTNNEKYFPEEVQPGKLYLVGVPLGNIGDMSLRAIYTLASVDCVAAEDTRRGQQLCAAFGLQKHFVSYHEHNRFERAEQIISRLQEGESWALITDAGMPAISDPGQVLVARCHDAKVPVCVVPGPTALTTAVAGLGMVEGPFTFYGFLPRHGKPRKEALHEQLKSLLPVVFYEAPHRLLQTLADFSALGLSGCQIGIARELTKRYEEYLLGSVAEMQIHFAEMQPRGEFVLILSSPKKYLESTQHPQYSPEELQDQIKSRLCRFVDEGMRLKDAAKLLADEFPLSSKEIYQLGIEN